jgi:hypothetical protein
MKKWMTRLLLLLTLSLWSCNFPILEEAQPTVTQEQGSPSVSATELPPTRPASQPVPSEKVSPALTEELTQRPAEAIVILEPGPGSRLTSPLRVAGMADPTFEQTLIVRIVLDDGTVLTEVPTTIHADLGERGPYEVEIPLNVQDECMALIQVYDVSARDGGIIHLSSVGVTLAGNGEDQIKPGVVHPEVITIHLPGQGMEIHGGVAHVEGIGIASFEGTLVVEVYDAEGALVGKQPLIVDAPEMGQPGVFSVDVVYSVERDGPGRIVVMDPLPAFNGIGHIASVEVFLGP